MHKLTLWASVWLMGCGSPTPEVATYTSDEGENTKKPEVDQVEIVRGVPDRGRDPAVVALRIGDSALCSGVLIAKDVVLTARHCVSRTINEVVCPADRVQVQGAHDATTIAVEVGDTVGGQEPAAHGLQIIQPDGVTLCEADIALILLDRPIRNIAPLGVRTTAVARGERIRSVGFGQSTNGGPAGVKSVREHVRVLATHRAEFIVGESTCHGDSGGPALDESTGQVVGIVSRGGASCEGADAHNVYTRTDVFSWLIDRALAKSGQWATQGEEDAGPPKGAPRAGSQKPPSDVGSHCESAVDCAAGVCVRDVRFDYCSRPCGSGDRCPSGYHCTRSGEGSVCLKAK